MQGFLAQPDFIILALAGLLVATIAWIARLESRLRKLMRGKTAASLEDVLAGTLSEVRELQTFRHDVQEYCADVERRLRGSVRGVATVRFDAFAGAGHGGKQSFATALLSEDGDGVVISSVYARDRVSVFAKPVSKRDSKHELSEEERQALTEAEKSCKL
jgi:hypothetical protein